MLDYVVKYKTHVVIRIHSSVDSWSLLSFGFNYGNLPLSSCVALRKSGQAFFCGLLYSRVERCKRTRQDLGSGVSALLRLDTVPASGI